MKKNKTWIYLALLLVAGILITMGNKQYLKRATARTETAAAVSAEISAESAAETEAALSDQGDTAENPDVLEDHTADAEDEKKTEEAAGDDGATPMAEEEVSTVISRLDTTAAEESVQAPAQFRFSSGEPELAAADSGGTEKDGEDSYYVKRFQDLDAQIQKNRETQTASNVSSSSKTAASNELKMWDGELNSVYNAILDKLDSEKREELVMEQRAWIKDRDATAMEAAKASSGGSKESIEYTISLTETTRQRAYELAYTYSGLLEQ